MRPSRPACQRRAKRGVALLLVLGFLALMVPLVAATVRVGVLSAVARDAHAARSLCRDALDMATADIERALTAELSGVVLEPDHPSPSVHVLDGAWHLPTSDRTTLRVSITAIDQRALPRPGDPVGAVLTSQERGLLIDLARHTSARSTSAVPALSWDTIADHEAEDRIEAPIYPRQRLDAGESRRSTDRPEKPSPLAERLAIHAPAGVRVVNLATAPLTVVRSIERELGLSLWPAVRIARDRNEAPNTALEVARLGATDANIRLTTSSDAWGFRVDARIGDSFGRSWWLVYHRIGAEWELVHSHEITSEQTTHHAFR